MANKPGSIFAAYGSTESEDTTIITENSTVDIDVEEEEEVQIIAEDSVYFETDYDNLKNKPKVKYGEDGEETELSGTVDLKDVIGQVSGGMSMVECNSQATDANKTATCESFEPEPNTWF